MTGRWVRGAALLTLVAVVAFVGLDVLASALAGEGYSMRRDYVSSLAARGSSVALLGQLCLTAYALAHVLAGVTSLLAWQTKVTGAFLVLTGVLFLGAVAFRASCPDGAAGCGVGEQAREASGLAVLEAGMHGVMAGLYALVMFATLLIAAVSAVWERGATRVVALLAVGFGWVSFTGIGQMSSTDSIGAWERLWLGASVGWLAAVALVALLSPKGPVGSGISVSWRSPARRAAPSPGTPGARTGSPPAP